MARCMRGMRWLMADTFNASRRQWEIRAKAAFRFGGLDRSRGWPSSSPPLLTCLFLKYSVLTDSNGTEYKLVI